ncbi:MAG TPA: hypothetical protein VM097_12345 [Mycobacteriales bacterium]|nr:hypothetical protein [Mycobacteriales bacterium]
MKLVSLGLAAALVFAAAPMTADAAGTSSASCRALRPHRWAPATGTSDARGNLRVIGLQYKQDVAHVQSYATFRTAMRCLMADFVQPLRRPGRPTLVVFNEDIGLMTLATGTRGAVVRQQAGTALRAPVGDQQPAAAASALGQLNAAYAPQVAAYQALFAPVDPRKQVLLAATDTFVRAFSTTFSDIARDYGVYVVASNNMATYRETHDPAEVALFGDPESDDGRAFVATSGRVPNATYLWGPRDTHPAAPAGAKNLLFRNEKIPLTQTEQTLLALDEGPVTGPAAIANARGWVVAGHRLGFGTSLPAFAWGYPFGKRPKGFQPCGDLRVTYASCMDALGVDTLIQAEANNGRWTGNGGMGYWQPLEWMESAWRSVADPTLRIRYAVNPFLVGNLLDMPFDGQSAILARGARTRPRAYVGNTVPERPDSGLKPQFLALAPWVRPDGPRADLLAQSARLAPGSGDAQENDYLQTAVYADLLPR